MPIAFNEAGVFSGAQGGPNILNNPTSLQFGPDGRLYVSEQNGSINAFTVELQNGEYVATAAEQLADGNGDELVKSIQNHNDDGSEADGATNRQVTGIVVAGTSEEPILYISSSDPRISTNQDSGLDTNSGIVTQATFNSTTNEWEVVDLVRGLPRSEENHSVNGMLLSEDGTKLLLNVGGFTNNGAASSFFSYTNEYALSGSVLELDLTALNALPDQIDPEGGQGNTPRTFKYDLPTLDDPNRENAPEGLTDAEAIAQGFLEDSGGMDLTGPFGGNDGLNMAILPADAPLRLYADGPGTTTISRAARTASSTPWTTARTVVLAPSRTPRMATTTATASRARRSAPRTMAARARASRSTRLSRGATITIRTRSGRTRTWHGPPTTMTAILTHRSTCTPWATSRRWYPMK